MHARWCETNFPRQTVGLGLLIYAAGHTLAFWPSLPSLAVDAGKQMLAFLTFFPRVIYPVPDMRE